MAAALQWSDSALDDLHAIRATLAADTARRVGRIVVEAVDCLMEFPERGRLGVLKESRELPLPGLPWRMVYTIAGHGGITILRVLAG